MPSKVMRLDDEAIKIALKYGENINEGILNMERKLQIVTPVLQNVTKPLSDEGVDKILKRLDRMQEGVKQTYAGAMEFISSGQGAVRIYKNPSDNPGFSEGTFVRASELKV